MDWAGWALFGLVATAALTAVMIAAQLAGLTRLDLPLVLGTLVTEDPDRARVAGFFIHLAVGQGFALGYAATFALLHRATWWLGALLGLAARRRRADGAPAAAARRPPADGLAPGGPGQHGRAGAARACSPSTTASRPLRSRSSPTSSTASSSGCSCRPADVRVPAAAPAAARARSDLPLTAGHRSATTGCSATPAPPPWSPATARSTGSACPASTASRSSAGSSAARPPGRSGSARPGRPTVVERRYRRHTATLETTWAVGGGRLTLTEAMVAEVAGRLLPATLLVRRLSAEGGAGRRGRRVRPAPRRAAPPAPGPPPAGGRSCASGGRSRSSLGCTPELTVEPGRPTSITVTPGRPVTLVLAVAHREPLVHVDPAAAWDLARRGRGPLAGLDRRRSTSGCRSATPSCAAC